MSNLQVLARRCPIMGKAINVRSASLAGAYGGMRAYHTRHDRAKFHNTAQKDARTVEMNHRKEACK